MNDLYFCNKRIDKIVFILFLDCKCLFILNIQRGEKISKVIYIYFPTTKKTNISLIKLSLSDRLFIFVLLNYHFHILKINGSESSIL